MKQVKLALATLASTALLSGCVNMYDTMEPQFESDQHFNMMDNHRAKQPRARHHYTRGEQVGPEVPFSESTKNPTPETATMTQQKPVTDTGTKTIPAPPTQALTPKPAT